MTRIRVRRTLGATPERVWEELRHLDRHVDWMADAESIAFTSRQRDGVGTTFDCRTRVGPVRLTDRMEITEWVDGEAMGVTHVGLVTGSGRFTLEPRGGDSTCVTWDEELRFPWWMAGPLGAWCSRPVLGRIWKANLARLAARVESPSDR